ncbi:hypothetical protein FDECE_1929 [Fusarium decemcellulare]|nr:hypothetical protein FDECE_1929 [Fusarium decemcellulare]
MASSTISTITNRGLALSNMPPEIIMCIVDNMFEASHDHIEAGYNKPAHWDWNVFKETEPKFERFQVWRDALNFAVTCKDFYHLVTGQIYTHDVKYNGGSALLLSAEKNSPSGLLKALKYGADINAGGFTGSSIFSRDHDETCRQYVSWYPLNHRDQITAIHNAAHKGHANIIELLLEHGADVNSRVRVDTWVSFYEQTVDAPESAVAPNYGCRPVNHAFREGTRTLHGIDIGMMQTALEHGANPLYFALLRGQRHVAQQLIKAGSSLVTHTGTGVHALHQACDKGDVEMVKLILDAHPGDVNIKNAQGYTPLQYLPHNKESRDDTIKIIDLLLERGADVNAESASGLIPLQTYCEEQDSWDSYVAASLIKHGSNTYEGWREQLHTKPQEELDVLAEAIDTSKAAGFPFTTAARDDFLWTERVRQAAYSWLYKAYYGTTEVPEDFENRSGDWLEFWWFQKVAGETFEMQKQLGGLTE